MMNYSKTKLVLFWIMGGFASSLTGIIASVIYWSSVTPEWNLDIVKEIMACTLMLPVGWVFCSIIPLSLLSSAMSWLSIGAFVWAYRVRRKAPLFVSYLACALFGIFWPKTFWSMMSV